MVLNPDDERLHSLSCYVSGLAPNFGIPLTVYATLVDGNVLYGHVPFKGAQVLIDMQGRHLEYRWTAATGFDLASDRCWGWPFGKPQQIRK